jgi:hypothetical protein
MITVPQRGQRPSDTLTPAEKYERLAKAFQHAATKADKYHILFLRTGEENERLAGQVQELLGMSDRFAAIEQAVEQIRDRREPLSETDGAQAEPDLAAALEVVKQDVVRLAADLGRERSARSSPAATVAGSTDTIDEFRKLLDGMGARMRALEEQGTLTADLLERLRDDVEMHHRTSIETNATLESLAAARDAVRVDLEEMRTRLDEMASREAELQDGSAVLASAIAPPDEAAEEIKAIEAVERISGALESTRAEVAAFQRDAGEMVSSLGEARKAIDEERTARKEVEHAQEQIRAQVDEIAAAIEALKSTFEMLSAMEAAALDESLDEDEIESVSEDASERVEGEVITPEIVEDNSETAQQMMLSAFLRFMHSSPRKR